MADARQAARYSSFINDKIQMFLLIPGNVFFAENLAAQKNWCAINIIINT